MSDNFDEETSDAVEIADAMADFQYAKINYSLTMDEYKWGGASWEDIKNAKLYLDSTKNRLEDVKTEITIKRRVKAEIARISKDNKAIQLTNKEETKKIEYEPAKAEIKTATKIWEYQSKPYRNRLEEESKTQTKTTDSITDSMAFWICIGIGVLTIFTIIIGSM